MNIHPDLNHDVARAQHEQRLATSALIFTAQRERVRHAVRARLTRSRAMQALCRHRPELC